MIDVAPTLRTNVFGELRQVGAVGFNGMQRRIALFERAQEFRDGLLNDGCSALRHSLLAQDFGSPRLVIIALKGHGFSRAA